MRKVYYHGDFDDEQRAKRIAKTSVMRILESNRNYLPQLGHATIDDAIAAIEDDAILKMADGKELWVEEA